jgi:hypothetical protein
MYRKRRCTCHISVPHIISNENRSELAILSYWQVLSIKQKQTFPSRITTRMSKNFSYLNIIYDSGSNRGYLYLRMSSAT